MSVPSPSPPGSTEISGGTPRRAKRSRLSRRLSHLLAMAFWVYLLTKLLILDIDAVALGAISPKLVPYRFLLVTTGLLLAAILLSGKNLLKVVLFVLFYPLIVLAGVLFWTIKHHLPIIALLPFLGSVFHPLRRQIICWTLVVLACSFIFVDVSAALTVVSMAFLLAFLGRHYFRAVFSAFAPANFVKKVTGWLEAMWKQGEDTLLTKQSEALKKSEHSRNSPEYAKQTLQNVGNALLWAALLQLGADELRRLQKSRIMLVYSFVLLFATILLTVVIFAFEYYGLHRVSSSSFTPDDATCSFPFLLYFSLCSFLTGNVGAFAPADTWSQLLHSAELVCTMLVGMMFVFMFTTVLREQHQERLSDLIQELQNKIGAILSFIAEEYAMPLVDAIRRLKETNTPTAGWIAVIFKEQIAGDSELKQPGDAESHPRENGPQPNSETPPHG